jgi:hypothetical protein
MLVRLRVCLQFVFAMALVFTGSVWAQPAGVTMTVEPYFGGHYKFGEWLPLRVTLANDGPALRVEARADAIEAGGQTAYTIPVDLPTGARKRVTLYVLPPSFAQTIRVRLMDGARELDSRSVKVTVERNADYAIGVLAPRDAAFVALNAVTLNPVLSEQPVQPNWFGLPPSRAVKSIPVSLDDVPDRPEGLRVLDALILSDVDTSSLSPEQAQALHSWVEQGGRLILGGGASAARTLAGLPDTLAGDFRSADAAANLESLETLAEFGEADVLVPGPFVAAWPASGRPLLEHAGGRPLIVEKRLGQGRVTYSALDLSASPFDAWAGASRFWEKLLTPGSTYPANAPPDVSPRAARAGTISYALQNLPVLDLPSIRSLAGLLAIYVVLVGPVNYLVLRRLRRLAWGWITIGALTALFSVGAFTVGFAMRGGEVILNKISILDFSAQGTAAPMHSYVGLFSPERRAYTLNFPGRVLVAPISLEGNPWGPGLTVGGGPTEIVQGEPAQARAAQVNQWTMQGFQAESAAPDGWTLESGITLDSDRVYGTLVNRTSQTLDDVVVVYGNRYARLGSLEPGQSQAFDAMLQSTFGSSFPYFLFEQMWQNVGPSGPPRELQMRQQLLENYYMSFNGPPQPPERPTLIGWMRASPLDVQVADARWTTQEVGLVIAALRVSYPAGHVRLPAGSLPVRLVGIEGNAGVCGSYNGEVYVDPNGSATLDFRVPDELLGMSVTRLAWPVGATGPGAPTLYLYDRNGEWIEHTGVEVDDPARFVLAEGVVRVRVKNESAASGCWRYELEVEGDVGNSAGVRD